eukprot:TRINITY_DN16660_c0_g1_i1.p3 TRINITY_DN16660_c0_g1~~TRINITY_DN16660_c0_g1_i1.p3  ORF type:complete len:83 (+),score=1.07 TRINITY_DN16660_c0_g1_i1:71-319(+)
MFSILLFHLGMINQYSIRCYFCEFHKIANPEEQSEDSPLFARFHNLLIVLLPYKMNVLENLKFGMRRAHCAGDVLCFLDIHT